MSRTPRRYAVYLHLLGGQIERVFFPKLETFQEWYQGLVNAENQSGFVNVPLSDLEGEYLIRTSPSRDRRARETSALLCR